MVDCLIKLIMLDCGVESWCRVAWVRIAHAINNIFHFLHVIDVRQIECPIQYVVSMFIVIEGADLGTNGSRNKWRRRPVGNVFGPLWLGCRVVGRHLRLVSIWLCLNPGGCLV